jgi:hypothetical protein
MTDLSKLVSHLRYSLIEQSYDSIGIPLSPSRIDLKIEDLITNESIVINDFDILNLDKIYMDLKKQL